MFCEFTGKYILLDWTCQLFIYSLSKEYSENEGGFDSFIVPDKVRTIGAGAFQSARKLKKIVLPENVDAIEDGALDCPSLETIDVAENNSSFRSINGILFSKDDKTLIKCPEAYAFVSNYQVPDGVERIEKRAFANCRKLRVIELPAETKEIGSGAFEGCSKLICFGVRPDNPYFYAGDSFLSGNSGTNLLFSKDRKVLLKYPAGHKADKYVVAGFIKEIADGAFEGCSFIKTIEIKDGVEKIGSGACEGCSSLESLIGPDSVATIANDAFDNNPKLVVHAYKGSYAERYVKEKNIKFETINEEEEIASTFRLSDDGKILYEYIGKGKKATIPDGVEAVREFTFDLRASGIGPRGDFSMLKTIVIPKSVKQIKGGFQSCHSLESIEVAEDNPNYRSIDGVLCSKDGKTLLWAPSSPKTDPFVVPDGVEVIGSRAFEGHGRIKSVVLPDGVKIIDDGAFMFCDSLESVELSKNLETIGRDAFYFCRSLKKIVLPKSVKTIRDGAFSHCSSLET